MQNVKDNCIRTIKKCHEGKRCACEGVLTLVKAALDSAEKEKGAVLSTEEEVAIVNREIKQTNQALEGAQKAQREDLIEQEEAKLVLLKSFLPKQLSEDEIVTMLTVE